MSKMIVVGSIAWAIARPQDQRTHQWCAYVRGLQHEDLAPIFRRVEFVLHPTFEPPRRAIDAPLPFVLRETGWGEFTLGITLFFADDLEKPAQLSHVLRLYDTHHSSATGSNNSLGLMGGEPYTTPVISEHLEEIVFTDPTEELAARLATKPRRAKEVSPLPPELADLMAPVLNVPPESLSDTADLQAIVKAQQAVDAEMQRLEARCAELEAAEQALKHQLQQHDDQ